MSPFLQAMHREHPCTHLGTLASAPPERTFLQVGKSTCASYFDGWQQTGLQIQCIDLYSYQQGRGIPVSPRGSILDMIDLSRFC